MIDMLLCSRTLTILCDLKTATVTELRALAADLTNEADNRAAFEDEGYRKFLFERRAALNIGDRIRVTINNRPYETRVKGFDTNYYGMPFVKFVIDWDEGAIEYNWNVSLVEKIS